MSAWYEMRVARKLAAERVTDPAEDELQRQMREAAEAYKATKRARQ